MKTTWQLLRAAFALVSVTFSLANSHAQTETVLYRFTGGSDGGVPTSSLVFDAAGNLYGTTVYGGISNQNCVSACGVVFELSPNSLGAWAEKVIYPFSGGTTG